MTIQRLRDVLQQLKDGLGKDWPYCCVTTQDDLSIHALDAALKEYDAAVAERDSLRAEVARLQGADDGR